MSTRARRRRQAKRIVRTLASLHRPLCGCPRKISLPDLGKRGGGEVMDSRRYGPRLSPSAPLRALGRYQEVWGVPL